MNASELAQLRKNVEEYVRGLFQARQTSDLTYHNLKHTEGVVKHAQELGAAAKLDGRALAVLFVACWFHDVGHLDGLPPKDHEERSVKEMMHFFESHPAPDTQFTDEATRCIAATKVPQQPANLLESIVCDADTYHFGTPHFWETNKTVKAELKSRGLGDATKGWREKTVQLLEKHQYFSAQARALLTEGKAQNLAQAKEKLAEKSGETETLLPETEAADAANPLSKKEAEREAKKHDTLIARGVQTGLKLASENHLKLSDMADGKANILISVNSIIIGVILSVLVRRLEVDTYLVVPTMIFLGSSVSTIILAIFSTLPNLTTGTFTREDVIAKKVNLLFFGNFYRSSFEDYTWAMNRLLADKDYLYGSLVKDIYFLGKVLQRKYTLIRWAYYVFMVGLIASVIAFVLAISLHHSDSAVQVVSPSRPPL